MPRRSAADAARTHTAILDRAVHMASTDGLEGLTIGRLAGDLGMSKAGVIGHFGTKEELQLEALAAATERWRHEVWDPVAGEEPGLRRLRALAARWSAFLGDCPFPGGCFLSAASFEFDDRPGPVRDALVTMVQTWQDALDRAIRAAVDEGHLRADTDAGQLLFEIHGLILALHHDARFLRHAGAEERARAAFARLLAHAATPPHGAAPAADPL